MTGQQKYRAKIEWRKARVAYRTARTPENRERLYRARKVYAQVYEGVQA